MFTGIVRQLGTVVARQPHTLTVDAGDLCLELGASLAVNGVCLTVTGRQGRLLTMDLSKETLSRTALGELRIGSRVNLEPSLRVGEELGGHLLLGHVDTVGKVALLERRAGETLLGVEFDPRFGQLVVDKGSIGVDGISLTPLAVGEGSFRCAVVPYTWEHTNLQTRRVGDRVNLEFDILAKYVRKWRER